ncbi:EI24 domain-containing protein [Sagittula salina]|uniref:EI24 domain-containing protein n=1 Tax=Sagittula salina TaxID=2820268 RepID=A0A940MIM1_9RHOB|nr:EI24 domain-containing protein [Sagittula salina]MBP0482440.1 EI24 domain-containing protein [Sagittula salina]
MIPDAVLKATGQLDDPRFRTVLAKGIGITIAVLFILSAFLVWGTGWLVGDSLTLPWIGQITWVDNVLSWAMVPVTAVLSVFLMVPVASAVTGLFLEDVAQAVEDRHYPGLGPATKLSVPEAVVDGLGFLGVMALANLVALVLYLLFAPLAPFIFWGVNGFLLGREYFIMAAARRIGRTDSRRLWRRHIGTLWIAGVLMAFPLTIPVVNLLVPVLGAAAFTHLFHRLNARNGAGRA